MEAIILLRKEKFKSQQKADYIKLIEQTLSYNKQYPLDIKFKELLKNISNIIFEEDKETFLNKLKIYLYDQNKEIYIDNLIDVNSIDELYSFENTIIDEIKLLNYEIDLKKYINVSSNINIFINEKYNISRDKINKLLDTFDQLIIEFDIIYQIRLNTIIKYLNNQSILIEEFKDKIFNILNISRYINIKNKKDIEDLFNKLKIIYPDFNIDINFNIEPFTDLDEIYAKQLQKKYNKEVNEEEDNE